jgi:protoporphyrinogen oxidase
MKYLTKSVVYTGDVRLLPEVLNGDIIGNALSFKLKELRSHGTTNILFACEPSDTNWTYLPNPDLRAHRIINTGSLSPNNTSPALRENGLSTSVMEFTGKVSEPEACDEAAKIPGFGHMIGYNYKQDTYVVHKSDTKEVITAVKKILESSGIFLTGRFAEWEYYNMDTAINSALVTSSQIIKYL